MSGRSPPLYCTFTLIAIHVDTRKTLKTNQRQRSTPSHMVVVIYYYYIGYKYKVTLHFFTLKAVPVSTQYFLTSVLLQLTRSTWYLNGFSTMVVVHKHDVQNKWEGNIHTEAHTRKSQYFDTAPGISFHRKKYKTRFSGTFRRYGRNT